MAQADCNSGQASAAPDPSPKRKPMSSKACTPRCCNINSWPRSPERCANTQRCKTSGCNACATSTAARWLAKRENEADLIGGVNLAVKDKFLAMTLADLSLTAQINDSLKLGKAVLGELGGINTLHKAHVEQAGFAEVYNVLHGFEGELDDRHHRNALAGWRFDGLPWEQC